MEASTCCWATEPMVEVFMADPQKGAITATNWSYAAQYGNIQSRTAALEAICRSKAVEDPYLVPIVAGKIKEHMKYLSRGMREATQGVHDRQCV